MINHHPKKVLLVDDQSNWRKMLRTLLEKEGYEVQEAVNFDEAKKKISENMLNLLILDLRLVDEDVFNVQGLELLRLAKSQAQAPAVVIFTGYPETIRGGVVESLGVDALLLKVPQGSRFRGSEFMKRIRALLAS
jgi:DNA-binding response OmpR family regulator